MEQFSLQEVVSDRGYAILSRPLYRDLVQHPLRDAPWGSRAALVERALYDARRQSTTTLAKRILRCAAQRCSVARIMVSQRNAPQDFRVAQIEHALRYAARCCSAALVERSLSYTLRRRRLVMLFECSLQNTPRPYIATLLKSLKIFIPGRYSIINGLDVPFYHRITGQRNSQELILYWAVHTRILILLMRCANGLNFFEVRLF